MELYFNELSIKNENSISHESVVFMAETYKELTKHDITTCRISPEDNAKLFQMIDGMPNSINVRNFYFSFFRSPYETKTVEENQDEYYEHGWTYNGEECIGFALAYLLDSASFSLYGAAWKDAFIDVLKDGDFIKVRNICVKAHVDMHIPRIRNIGAVELVACDMKISDKKIVLRDDHGKDKLEEFSRRLIQCPYLVGVVNSLPYNSHERKFIRRVRENGLVEIVLPWTDKGYGVVVKTTGRTIKETKKIAEILEEEYGYM